MKKQLVLFSFCLICFSVLSLPAQEILPEIQAAPWNLDYQIRLQNIQNPQFADVVRQRILKNKFAIKQANDEELLRRKIRLGEARIQAGNASTNFKYNPNLTLKDYLLLKSDSTELRQIVEKNAEICLKMFRQSLRDNRLAQNDVVDAGALAFIISYEIYFGEKPSRAHLGWMRKKGREILLNLAGFQGVDDAERQRSFEIYGVLTMYAKILQSRGFRGDSAAQTEAKETAEEVLREVWGSPAETIQMLPVGFIHRGQKIILDGQATTTFKFNPSLQTAQKLSGGSKEIEAEYQSFLAQNYQTMSARGMPINDSAVCGAYSFSQIYPLTVDAAELTQTQFEGVYGVLKKAVLTSANIQAASDENKQITCELFVIRAALLKKQIAVNPINAKLLAGQFISGIFSAYGEDFKNYRMTDGGFVKIGSSNAVSR